MIEEQAELALDDRQREAVMEAVRHGILIVTGGPGTGKNDDNQCNDPFL